MSEVVLKLKEPIQVGSEQITELKFRKMKAKDIRNLPAAPNTGDLLNIAGKLCAQPPSVIDELGMEDTVEVLEVVSSFLPGSRPTGGKD